VFGTLWFDLVNGVLARPSAEGSARRLPARCRLSVETLESRDTPSGGLHAPDVLEAPPPDAGTAPAVVDDTAAVGYDAQRGYPQPPTRGPALHGNLTVNMRPGAVLPQTNGPSPGGTAVASGQSAPAGTAPATPASAPLTAAITAVFAGL
jgi:hypothetical protein